MPSSRKLCYKKSSAELISEKGNGCLFSVCTFHDLITFSRKAGKHRKGGCIITRYRFKKAKKPPVKAAQIFSMTRKSPVLLDFFADQHCINIDVKIWWRRRELNPRPKPYPQEHLRVQFMF